MIIVDLDGTLTVAADEAAHCMSDTHSKEDILRIMDPVKIAKLLPRQDIINKINAHYENGDFVAIITGRWNFLHEVTRAWLQEHDVKYHVMGMRDNKDWDKNSVVIKLQAYNEIMDAMKNNGFADKIKEVVWYDDHQEMLTEAAKLGITTVQV